jgi:hypothetical protein
LFFPQCDFSFFSFLFEKVITVVGDEMMITMMLGFGFFFDKNDAWVMD